MRLHDDGTTWYSPSDIGLAASCEYGILHALDVQLGRRPRLPLVADPMLARTAELGDAHEARFLSSLLADRGTFDGNGAGGILVLDAAGGHEAMLQAAERTRSALADGVDGIFQATFCRNRLAGRADFLLKDPRGRYEIWDTKLARKAKVSALLQIAAYADQLIQLDVPVAPEAHLHLGTGKSTSHRLADILPIYRRRKARLEDILDRHCASNSPALWGNDDFAACASCQACQEAIAAQRDLHLVANIRRPQRDILRRAGIRTIDQLASSAEPVVGLTAGQTKNLRAQAALQVHQCPPDGPERAVSFVVHDPSGLALIPPGNPGDIFFDFEGDPLWSDGNDADTGLEYLFGLAEKNSSGGVTFRAFWAHDRGQEKQALQDFTAYVERRRQEFPGMHVYHYAAYENAALLRLASRHGVCEAEVEDWLRHDLFVDLFKVVRKSIRVSQPSYSLKKLEPLYMGGGRSGQVTAATDSIVAYAGYCDAAAVSPEAAWFQLLDIARYNMDDCVSTLRLRDWLTGLREQAGIPPALAVEPGQPGTAPATPHAEVAAELRFRLATTPSGNTQLDHAVAMLAAAIEYHGREARPFWGLHFDRLQEPREEWANVSGIIDVATAEVVRDWGQEGKERKTQRFVALTGVGTAGTAVSAGDQVFLLYPHGVSLPGPPARPGYRVSRQAVIRNVVETSEGVLQVEVAERTDSPEDTWAELPMAVTPGKLFPTGGITAAIASLGSDLLDRSLGSPSWDVPSSPAFELLMRSHPRSGDGTTTLPPLAGGEDQYIDAIEKAVVALQDSFVAVQGPPGSGKTYTAAQVVRRLVDRGWKIAVVAQSHKTIENLLHAVGAAGVPPSRIGKLSRVALNSPWTELKRDADVRAWVAEDSGRVFGGTTWDLTNRSRVLEGDFDLVVVDEAGQFSLANTIAVSRVAPRLLLLGDPQQLPQVSQASHPEPVDYSALGWLCGEAPVLNPAYGYFISMTRRMHPDLCAADSRLSYDDELQAHPSTERRRLFGGPRPGVLGVPVDHSGNGVESPEEAEAVVMHVQGVLGCVWDDPHSPPARPLTQDDILVVAPYNAQVRCIRRVLVSAGLHDVEVGTVDRFQGREAPIVIVSMTASSADDIPRGLGFVLNRNRLNVAISRAQWASMVLFSPELMDHLPANPTLMSDLGAFIGLVTDPGQGPEGQTPAQHSPAELNT